MKLLLSFVFAMGTLVACTPVTQTCNVQGKQKCFNQKTCSCKFEDRDHGISPKISGPVSSPVQAPEPTPQPQPTPSPTPPAEPEREVCDGGARGCRGDEKPTGTESDPTKYIDRQQDDHKTEPEKNGKA